MKLILSICGGGIRGAIPATFLLRLEQRTGKPCGEIFDLIAGTSTGGILACALAAKIPAQEIVNLYRDKGASIFARKWNRQQFLRSKYAEDGIDGALGEVFGARKFTCLDPRVLVPAFDMVNAESYHFKSWDCDPGLTSVEVARATSAAPTYFPLAGRRFADGGLFANDPSMNALIEAQIIWPRETMIMLSLGTGFKAEHLKVVEDGGIVEWGPELITILMGGSASDVEYMVKASLGPNFLRVNEALPDTVNAAMDDATTSNIVAMEQWGDQLASKYAGHIFQIKSLLK